MPGKIQNIAATIDYIEGHLQEKLDLEKIAKAVHYSKYHLHRMFRDTVGMTIQTYVQRRQLTEAARLLVFSDRPILEIALSAGYESQQSFTDIFKAMYKRSPNRYREEKDFYPLQMRYVLNGEPAPFAEADQRDKIVFATMEDIPGWMELVHLVIDGFPCLDEAHYLGQLQRYIKDKRALILKDADTAVGIMAFHEMTGSIDFFGVHPQYRKGGIERAFCEKVLDELARPAQISVTTFREGDKADTGHRKMWERLGFVAAGALVEFGYPTQRFILPGPLCDPGERISRESLCGPGERISREPLCGPGERIAQETHDHPWEHVLQKERTEGKGDE